eukprot:scaffold5101_cov169-Alexandrium_tamarense.AAC.1
MVPLLIVDAGSGTISGCEELAEVRCSRPPLSPVDVSYSSVHHSSEKAWAWVDVSVVKSWSCRSYKQKRGCCCWMGVTNGDQPFNGLLVVL